MKPINVYSFFDGISCGQLALKKAGVKVNTYHASEICKWAIKVTKKNFPSTLQMGDITKLEDWRLKLIRDEIGIDLVIGGSPCQDLSFAGKGKGLQKGTRSSLFFEFVKCLKILSPKYFLLENVRMSKTNQDIISDLLGVEPMVINSNKLSPQSRHRLYWFNWDVKQPEDKGLILSDILQPPEEVDKKYLAGAKLLANYQGGNQLNSSYKSQANTIHNINKPGPTISAGTHGYASGYVKAGAFRGRYNKDGTTSQQLEIRKDNKSNALTSVQKDNVVVSDNSIRKLTPIEYARLQTVPDNYCDGVSDTQKYKQLGNGMTVDVIAHILKGITV